MRGTEIGSPDLPASQVKAAALTPLMRPARHSSPGRRVGSGFGQAKARREQAAVGPGEVAEFDTRLPHCFGPAGDQPVEILSLFGGQGERIHVRAAPRNKVRNA